MNKLQINRMATTVLFAVLVFVSSVALAQKPIKRPPKKVRQTTTQQVAKPPKKTVAPAKTSKPTTLVKPTEVEEPVASAKPTTGELNGHEWVDLGLSVKWATMNIGAYSELDYGDYFAWGETSPNSVYSKDISKTMGLDLPDISGNKEYDAARANWGGSWRMPTKKEWQELRDKCEWTFFRDKYGIATGPNGNSIKFPLSCAMLYEGDDLDKIVKTQAGFYWSSSPTDEDSDKAFFLYLHPIPYGVIPTDRSCGFVIRPVTN